MGAEGLGRIKERMRFAAPPGSLPLAEAPPLPPLPPRRAPLPPARALLQAGLVDSDALVAALRGAEEAPGGLFAALLQKAALSPAALAEFQAAQAHLPAVSAETLAENPPDIQLLDRWGADKALGLRLLPWRDIGGVTLILAEAPGAFAEEAPRLRALFGPVRPVIMPAALIEDWVLRLRGPQLDKAACTRVAAEESCRNWPKSEAPYLLGLALLVLTAALYFRPLPLFTALTLWALVTLALSVLLRLAALLALRAPMRQGPIPPPSAEMRQGLWPRITLLVPLYGEARIAPRLVQRLNALDYPKARLEIFIVVEERDAPTRAALAQFGLPPHMRVVPVPEGRLKTKPRALNHALTLARGQIIGIYDAEDAPATDQLRQVARAFHTAPADVACLQGVLDFYNPRQNWLARCFTLEYAAWFRVFLPGLARLGLPLPLGGTTLFFRRRALEALGAWDAHNVTEDADLGMRLARRGYRTALLPSVTYEEANCRLWPWVRQRSRWLKGYMMTYATHMRAPGRLWRELGPWKFFGFQLLFLTTLSQFLLAPLLLSFWGLALGLPHPVMEALGAGGAMAVKGLFLGSEVLMLAMALIGLRLSRQKMNPLWVLAQHIYFPLATLAAYKALWEMLRRPFYWDKTAHGLDVPSVMPTAPASEAPPPQLQRPKEAAFFGNVVPVSLPVKLRA